MKKIFQFVFTAFVFTLFKFSMAQDLNNIQNQKPFEITGTASGSVGYYQSSAFNSTRKPYSYSIMAAPTISVYGVQIPLNFTFTEGSKTVTNPFAQFGVNPYWKWIKLYAGWTNMSWSPTTLNGKTFLGIGVELNPSLFRFGAMYGRFNPAIKEDTLKAGIAPQFKRRGWGLKLGVGNQDNYFDFIWLHAKDIASSIPPITDTVNQFSTTPAENAVFGIRSHQSFLKKKLVWDLDGAASAYTRDLNSQLLDIGTGIGTNFLRVAIPPRLSTSYAWTAHTAITYKCEKYTLGIDYNRIQPEYRSMGVDYLLNDQEKISLTENFNALKKKLLLNFGETYQHDDLNQRKAIMTHRTGFNSTIALNLNQNFGVSFSYNNFIMFQTKGLKELNDTTKLFQVQQNIVAAPRYTLIGKKLVQNIFMALAYSRLDDLNSFTAKFSRNSTVNWNVGYSLSVTKIGFSFAPSFNVLYSQTPIMNLMNVGPSVSLSKSFYKGKISTSVMLGFTASKQNDNWTSKTLNNTININYRITAHHALKLSNSIMKTFFAYSESHEYKGSLAYTYTFSYSVDKNRKQEKNF